METPDQTEEELRQKFPETPFLAGYELLDNRMKLCNNCQHNVLKVCTQCGCFLPAKLRLKASTCPLNKW